MTYPEPYQHAWDAMTEKPWAWGLAPIHHGCFENGWTGAIEAAAQLADAHPDVAASIRALAVWTPADDEIQGDQI